MLLAPPGSRCRGIQITLHWDIKGSVDPPSEGEGQRQRETLTGLRVKEKDLRRRIHCLGRCPPLRTTINGEEGEGSGASDVLLGKVRGTCPRSRWRRGGWSLRQ